MVQVVEFYIENKVLLFCISNAVDGDDPVTQRATASAAMVWHFHPRYDGFKHQGAVSI